jgi:uncharacterized membrane protein YbaN (DUF454 family)
VNQPVTRPPATEDKLVARERSPLWRMARLVAGWLLVALGIVGLALPILQGVALILAGLALLAPDVPFARRWLDWLKNRVRKLRRDRRSGGDPEGK